MFKLDGITVLAIWTLMSAMLGYWVREHQGVFISMALIPWILVLTRVIRPTWGDHRL